MTASKRQIVVVADAAALAVAAADRLIARLQTNSERFAVCLTGGSSPKQLYRLLAMPDYAVRIPWRRVHWFIGDERFVAQHDALSNIGMARAAFLDACAPLDTIHPIPTDLDDPEAAAYAYEATLRDFYGSDRLDPARPLFDMVLMGVGPDGHTASLFPEYPGIDERRRWVVGVPEAGVAPFVPRVTLTLPPLASCREMLFLLSGPDKRAIAAQMLARDDLPASRAHSENDTVWMMDAAARPEGLDVA